jgi:hypothetical protein
MRRAPLAALANRLRQGPLEALLSLHDRTNALAAEGDTDPARQLEQLAELVRLSQLAMDRFQLFTIELKVLVFELGQARDSQSDSHDSH